jgi:nitrite reductase/ring-hydroxylating ferredoxin subunit
VATDTQREPADGCAHCELRRRAFLRDAGLAIAAAIVGIGTARSTALAAAVETIRSNGARGAVRSYAIPRADGVYVDADNEVILARWQNQVYAFSIACPHRGATLEWRPAENRVFCPKHKARFRPDGAHDSGRQSRDLDRFDIRRAGEQVIVDLDGLRRADTDSAAWLSAVVRVA